MEKNLKKTYWLWSIILVLILIVLITFFEYGESFGKALAK
jgi:hypothetical protein